ncbi:MAG: reverse transcriptase/maturase family protein [Patescibacteria group bacterium]
MTQLLYNFFHIISTANLLQAWQEFIRGKRHKPDVQAFQFGLMDNLFQLNHELKNHAYRHGAYKAFKINDPKPRDIHKASVRDRVLHHAIYRKLYPYFHTKFIADSFSCRIGKGTHKALNRFRAFGYQVSRNDTKQCWILKCDIRKFFASIDHQILLNILAQHIADPDILNLLREIIASFHSTRLGVGLPLGNLTSQLLVNIYLNELDQFLKHELRIKHYVRYADDFVIFSRDQEYLTKLIPKISTFLQTKLKLQLHPHKVSIKTLASGVDFLGWVHFPDHRVLRKATRKRMLAKLQENGNEARKQSYLGMLGWGNGWKLVQRMRI